VDQSEVQKSIAAVVSMATCGVGEAQVSAAQILCNLCNDQTKHTTLLQSGCVPALVRLMNVEFQSCNQHAICALTHLSSSRNCQEVLMRDRSFLQTLLPLCSDGNYNSIEMRRECARLLANLSCGGAREVVRSAGEQRVEAWLQSVEGLKDERLRVHADRAKGFLSDCIEA